jgi:hypothetical protein
MRGLGLAMALFLMAGCTKDDEWCTQLVKDACGCEGDDPDSDLCQDAGVVADEEDEGTCESYYFANVPGDCQTQTFTSDGPPTVCDELAACLGVENDGSATEADCKTALEAARSSDVCF